MNETTGWIRLGSIFLNLNNVCEVHIDERLHKATVNFVGAGALDLYGDDARDLATMLSARAQVVDEPHRTVFPVTRP